MPALSSQQCLMAEKQINELLDQVHVSSDEKLILRKEKAKLLGQLKQLEAFLRVGWLMHFFAQKCISRPTLELLTKNPSFRN